MCFEALSNITSNGETPVVECAAVLYAYRACPIVSEVPNQLPSVCRFVIKTHDSESRGQEEAGHMQRMSVLFTGSTSVKFVNALNKPP